jgi:hypothetical protein
MGLFTVINSKFWTHYLRARGARVGRNHLT